MRWLRASPLLRSWGTEPVPFNFFPLPRELHVPVQKGRAEVALLASRRCTHRLEREGFSGRACTTLPPIRSGAEIVPPFGRRGAS